VFGGGERGFFFLRKTRREEEERKRGRKGTWEQRGKSGNLATKILNKFMVMERGMRNE
jgi:hypothetical protein